MGATYASMIIAVFVLISILVSNYNRGGTGDFYYHASVINELNSNLLNPTHPSYGTDETTQYFTPYHVLVSAVSRLTGLQAADALHVMAFINALLFLLALSVFCKAVYGYYNACSLLFVLFLWGGVWGFSGEYSYRIIGTVAAYHSMFSLWLMLVVYSIALKVNKFNFMLLPLLSMIGIISQPITFFAFTLGVCILLRRQKRSIRPWLIMSSVYLSLVAGLVVLWPYYPVLQLQSNSSSSLLTAWPGSIFPMYDPIKVFKVLWPLLLISPVLMFARIKENGFLLLISVGLLVPYLALSWTKSELIGRNLPIIVMFLLIAVAYSYDKAVEKYRKALLLLVILLPVMAYNVFMGAYKYSKRDGSFLRELKEELVVVSPLINHYDVVITDINTGYYMVAYSGKIVATIFPQKFVKDNTQRVQGISDFYDSNTDNSHRKELISRYGAKYILINKKKQRIARNRLFEDVNPAVQDSISCLGKTVLDLKQLRLLKVIDYDSVVSKQEVGE